MKKQRARQLNEKLERRNNILCVSRRLFIQKKYQLASVDEIAKHAGLAKGTVYLYFKTKEEIYLNLLEEYIRRLFEAIHKGLEKTVDVENVISSIVRYVSSEPAFLHLASMGHSVLEKNLDAKVAYRYKSNLMEQLNRCGQSVQKTFTLEEHSGCCLLLRTYALMLGIWQISSKSPVFEEILKEERFLVFDFDFASELENSLIALWNGLIQRDHHIP